MRKTPQKQPTKKQLREKKMAQSVIEKHAAKPKKKTIPASAVMDKEWDEAFQTLKDLKLQAIQFKVAMQFLEEIAQLQTLTQGQWALEEEAVLAQKAIDRIKDIQVNKEAYL